MNPSCHPRAVSCGLEDPILQAAFDHLVHLGDSIEGGADVARERICRGLGIFLPPARASMAADILSRRKPASTEASLPPHAAVFCAITLRQTIAELPIGNREDAFDVLIRFDCWKMWHGLAESFVAISDTTLSSPRCRLIQPDRPPRIIPLRGDTGITLSTLIVGENIWVSHNEPGSAAPKFSGLQWPANTALWMKPSDAIRIGDHNLRHGDLLGWREPVNDSTESVSLWEEDGIIHTRLGEPVVDSCTLQLSSGFLLTPGMHDHPVLLNDRPIHTPTPVTSSDEIAIRSASFRIGDLIRILGEDHPAFRLNIEHASVIFPDGQTGLSDLSIHLASGELVAVMGPSGCGKSTLLGVLSGDIPLGAGSATWHSSTDESLPLAHVPQDDVLFEELTVEENLRYARKMRRPSLESAGSSPDAVDHTLNSVGLASKRDLRVGGPLKKVISGGQRKRLNIALELVADPRILLLDEPTSGLSSADATAVVDLLRTRADSGTLVVVVIHQPSAELLETFDRLIVLDVGGMLAYDGPPSKARSFFSIHVPGKAATNWGPEKLVETLSGTWTSLSGDRTRKHFSARFWQTRFKAVRHRYTPALIKGSSPEFQVPTGKSPTSFHRQIALLAGREALRKTREWRSLAISLVTAAILSALIGLVCRASPLGQESYLYSRNPVVPAAVFLCVILILFMALSNAVQEMVKDRTHRSRERLLGYSGPAWIIAKIPSLIILSALHAAIVLSVTGSIIGIAYAWPALFLAFFLTGISGATLGLWISSLPGITPRIAVAAVPLLLIPQMMLCGAAPFRFADITHLGSAHSTDSATVAAAPPITGPIPSRWAFQAAMCALRDDPEISAIPQGKLLAKTYNIASRSAAQWRQDPEAFFVSLRERLQEDIQPAELAGRIRFAFRLGMFSENEIRQSLGDLVPLNGLRFGELREKLNSPLLGTARADFPPLLPGSPSPYATALARIMLLSLLFVVLACGASLVPDIRPLFRRRASNPPTDREP